MSSRQRFYGFFRCGDCNKVWESAHVYQKGARGVYWTQECKHCETAWEPYKAEPIVCRICGLQKCRCSQEEKEDRHTDPRRDHRSDLCTKCQSGDYCKGSI